MKLPVGLVVPTGNEGTGSAYSLAMPPMPNGKQEVEELEKLAGEHAGARFRLADLQLHTPKDKRFKPGGPVSTPGERQAFAQAYVQAAADSGLEMIGVTEHNDVSWLADLGAAAKNAGLLFFPGFEVASSDGVHVLGHHRN
jgi:hypothetical protein